jgi:signal transduction histidine kinase
MKLQNKINLRFLMVTLLVFTIAGVIFYFALGNVINHNIRGILKSRKTNIVLYLQRIKTDSLFLRSPDRTIFIRQIAKTAERSTISDTLAYDEREKEQIPFRKMVFTTSVENNCFEVTILQSLLESEDLQAIILYFMLSLFVLILSALFFLNRWLSNKAWKPFFLSSNLLKTWKLGVDKPLQFEMTGISEFDQLNRTLEEMARKMQADYVNLKEFTENASHEIQTPLAIVKSKIELLLNDQQLTSRQHKQVHEVFETINRLSRLNEALLLLARIENRQFIEKSGNDLCKLIESRLDYLEELLDSKEIELSMNLTVPFVVVIHPVLADILINNLLGNALRHNLLHGKIIVSTGTNEIIFSNTGSDIALDPQKIFKRFVKRSNSEESNGLGLAIATEICRSHQLSLNYTYSEPFHIFTLSREK